MVKAGLFEFKLAAIPGRIRDFEVHFAKNATCHLHIETP